MAVINGSLTINATSSLRGNGGVIKSGSVTIGSTSALSARSSVKYTGNAKIKASSKMSIFWLKMEAKSQMMISNSVVLKTGRVAINSVSTLMAELLKAGKEFIRRAVIEGDVVSSTVLEGGGNEYMKVNQDIQLTSGDHFEITVKIFDEEGNPKDITGSTFHWKMFKVVKTESDGIVIANATDGEITIILKTEDTINIHGDYTHQLRMTDAQNHSTTILKGLVRIEK